ncbi:MAG: M1 family metallopeptidase [Gemmatimonadales bacterium]
MRRVILLASLIIAPALGLAAQTRVFTHADTLRGSNTPERAWWDATFYDLHVRVDPADSSIIGANGITYRVLSPGKVMQIDLQPPLDIDSIIQDGRHLASRRDGNAFFVSLKAKQRTGQRKTVWVYYHGSWRPTAADTGRRRFGGPFHWNTDSLGRPWIATADEGPGASTWWPVKDLPADEPDSQRIAITVPDPMIDVSNGRLRSTTHNPDGTTTFEWFVADPINTYDVAINATAGYVAVRDTFTGTNGPLTIEFWSLAAHRAEAEALIPQVKTMLGCFEHWFGPYPWYPDGYKLIEAPYLGMEHQSGIAYGNRYLPGYIGRDLSGTGEGLGWDYIVVHESAHEWFGNNISAKDHADMWIHESFAMYAEALYLECTKDHAAGDRYLVGVRKNIKNDEPIIGTYGVNDTPRSQDRYFKGANMLMTLRAAVNDDAKWLATLRGLNATFWHQTVTAKDIRDYMSAHTGVDLQKIFVQYQETTMIPALQYKSDGTTLSYRWNNVIPGFAMPVGVALGPDSTAYTRLTPTADWQTMPSTLSDSAQVWVDPEFYVTAELVKN